MLLQGTEIIQWITVFAAKSDLLSSIPGTHVMERENPIPHAVLWPLHATWIYTCVHIHTINKCKANVQKMYLFIHEECCNSIIISNLKILALKLVWGSEIYSVLFFKCRFWSILQNEEMLPFLLYSFKNVLCAKILEGRLNSRDLSPFKYGLLLVSDKSRITGLELSYRGTRDWAGLSNTCFEMGFGWLWYRLNLGVTNLVWVIFSLSLPKYLKCNNNICK